MAVFRENAQQRLIGFTVDGQFFKLYKCIPRDCVATRLPIGDVNNNFAAKICGFNKGGSRKIVNVCDVPLVRRCLLAQEVAIARKIVVVASMGTSDLGSVYRRANFYAIDNNEINI